MVLHYSTIQAEKSEVHIVRLLQRGGCKIYLCLRGQKVGGTLNVHVCPLGVGRWSK